MNRAMLKALTLDAFYQVLDNRVFRILLILVLIPILITFMVGFREEEIVFLFGVERWSYDSLVSFLMAGGRPPQNIDHQGLIISNFVSLFVNFAGGNLGVMLSVAATAFFVPRMVEKGSADVLFHKPIHRFLLFLSRYFAGLIFIALITLAAVVGIYLGLLIVSGYNDPGILWACLTLTYLFGLVHCVSMLVGVMTRSTVAAILVTLLFFFGNGCVHKGWILKEQITEQKSASEQAELDELLDESDEAFADEMDLEEDPSRFLSFFLKTLDAAHLVLPKTTDAGYITTKLRSALEAGDVFADENSRLTLRSLGEDLSEVDADAARLPIGGAEEILGTPVFAAEDDQGRAFSIWSRERQEREVEVVGRIRHFPESSRKTGDTLQELVISQLGLDDEAVERDRESMGANSRMGEMGPLFLTVPTNHVSWSEGGRHYHVMLVTIGKHFHALILETAADLEDEARTTWERKVLRDCGVLNSAGEEEWYTAQLDWDAELKFNLFFSIASSLAFAALVLLLGGWKLSRLDF